MVVKGWILKTLWSPDFLSMETNRPNMSLSHPNVFWKTFRDVFLDYSSSRYETCMLAFLLLSLPISLCHSLQPVKADNCPPRDWFCSRFLPVKRTFFLSTVTKCLLMVGIILQSTVWTCFILKVPWDSFCHDLQLACPQTFWCWPYKEMPHKESEKFIQGPDEPALGSQTHFIFF